MNEIKILQDVSNIPKFVTDLSLTENTKYTTVNGVKEFECKDGYVDNITIEGQTKILDANNKETTAGATGANLVSVGQGDKIEVLTCDNKTELNVTWVDNKGLDSNNGTEYSSDLRMCTDFIDISNFKYFTHTGIRKFLVVNFYDINKSFITTIPNTKNYIPSQCKYLRVSIDKTSEKYNNIKLFGCNNYDKKQILTTLRSLPNGTKDIVYKQGDKYYKIKRCQEITLNGGENWAESSATPNVNTTRFKLTNSVLRSNNIICDKFSVRNGSHTDSEYIVWVDNVSGFNNDIVINILRSKLSTQDVTGFKTWLQSNPITIVYELETPILEELPNFNPRTFDKKTTLLLNTGVVQTDASFEVTNSTRSELEVLKGILSDLGDYVDPFDIYTPILLNGLQSSGDNIYVARQGNLCVMQFTAKYTGGITTGTMLTVLPVGFRPTQSTRVIGGFSSNIQFNVNVNAGGKVIIENTLTGDGYIRINMSWITG